jgi:hypothetical protein
MQENQIHIRLTEGMPGIERLLRRIDEAEVHHLDVRTREPALDHADVFFEAFLQSGKLRPIRV